MKTIEVIIYIDSWMHDLPNERTKQEQADAENFWRDGVDFREIVTVEYLRMIWREVYDKQTHKTSLYS